MSDTSVLVHLAALDQLKLLQVMFGQVVIPEAVRGEVQGGGEGSPGYAEVMAGGWILTRAVGNHRMVAELEIELDRGEAEAIALAEELGADLLIDARRGAAVAERMGIFHTGLIGVLLRAKKEKHLLEIKPVLERLANETTFRMSKAVMDSALNLAGE